MFPLAILAVVAIYIGIILCARASTVDRYMFFSSNNKKTKAEVDIANQTQVVAPPQNHIGMRQRSLALLKHRLLSLQVLQLTGDVNQRDSLSGWGENLVRGKNSFQPHS